MSREGVSLREPMAQAFEQVEGQAREVLERSLKGLLQAERDTHIISHREALPVRYYRTSCALTALAAPLSIEMRCRTHYGND